MADRNRDENGCKIEIDVHCDLHYRYSDASVTCGSESVSSDDKEELECGLWDDDDICDDLDSAQQAAGATIAFSVLTVLLSCIPLVLRQYKYYVYFYATSGLSEVIVMISAYICAGCYYNFIHAATSVDVYSDDEQENLIASYDVDWTMGYSWILMIIAASLNVILLCFTGQVISTANYKKLRQLQEDFISPERATTENQLKKPLTES